jgi:oligogalacturonide lyase
MFPSRPVAWRSATSTTLLGFFAKKLTHPHTDTYDDDDGNTNSSVPARSCPTKLSLLVLSLMAALGLAGAEARAQAPPSDWTDPATGHRVLRLSGDDGGSNLYFHQNVFTPKGDKVIFNTRAGIAAVDLTRLGKEPVKAEVVVPGARALAVAWRTPDVYYLKAGALVATNLETKATRKVTEARGTVINADETLLLGIVNDAEAAAKVKELGLPMLVTADLVSRDEPPGRLKPGGRSLALVVTDLKSGAVKKIHYSTEWLNHLQASPADPQRVLFCHEGAWHQVDRVWTIRADGKDLKLMHKRTVRYEIAGHEFFSHDGKWVWYDLQTPRSKDFWLAGVQVDSGERIRYPIARENWSVHYTNGTSLRNAVFCRILPSLARYQLYRGP